MGLIVISRAGRQGIRSPISFDATMWLLYRRGGHVTTAMWSFCGRMVTGIPATGTTTATRTLSSGWRLPPSPSRFRIISTRHRSAHLSRHRSMPPRHLSVKALSGGKARHLARSPRPAREPALQDAIAGSFSRKSSLEDTLRRPMVLRACSRTDPGRLYRQASDSDLVARVISSHRGKDRTA